MGQFTDLHKSDKKEKLLEKNYFNLFYNEHIMQNLLYYTLVSTCNYDDSFCWDILKICTVSGIIAVVSQ